MAYKNRPSRPYVFPRNFPRPPKTALKLGTGLGTEGEFLMAGKLTARKVTTATAGKYSDGGNLYLIVSETGARKWVLRFTWRGRAKEMGLGSAASVPLADARERAAIARRMIAQGLNPIDEGRRIKLKAVWATPPRRTAPTETYEAERRLTELADWLGQ